MKTEILTINGSLIKIWYENPKDRTIAIKEATLQIKTLQANIAQNPGFETVNPSAQYQPANWTSVINSGTASFPYNSPSDLPGRTGKGAAIVTTPTAVAYWFQRVAGLVPSSQYTLTAYSNLTSVVGTVFLEIDWFDASGTYISGSSSTSSPISGTISWTQQSVTSTAPPNASSANIILLINGSGTVVFDDVVFTGAGGTPPPGGTTPPPGGTTPPPGGTTPPPTVVCQPGEINVVGTCINKTYLIVGGVGLLALMMLGRR